MYALHQGEQQVGDQGEHGDQQRAGRHLRIVLLRQPVDARTGPARPATRRPRSWRSRSPAATRCAAPEKISGSALGSSTRSSTWPAGHAHAGGGVADSRDRRSARRHRCWPGSAGRRAAPARSRPGSGSAASPGRGCAARSARRAGRAARRSAGPAARWRCRPRRPCRGRCGRSAGRAAARSTSRDRAAISGVLRCARAAAPAMPSGAGQLAGSVSQSMMPLDHARPHRPPPRGQQPGRGQRSPRRRPARAARTSTMPSTIGGVVVASWKPSVNSCPSCGTPMIAGDRDQADVGHRRHPQAGGDHRHGDRQLDLEQPPQPAVAHRGRGLRHLVAAPRRGRRPPPGPAARPCRRSGPPRTLTGRGSGCPSSPGSSDEQRDRRDRVEQAGQRHHRRIGPAIAPRHPAERQRDDQPEHQRARRQPGVWPQPAAGSAAVLVESSAASSRAEPARSGARALRSAAAACSIAVQHLAGRRSCRRSRPSSSTTTPRPDGDDRAASRAARRTPPCVATVPPRCSSLRCATRALRRRRTEVEPARGRLSSSTTSTQPSRATSAASAARSVPSATTGSRATGSCPACSKPQRAVAAVTTDEARDERRRPARRAARPASPAGPGARRPAAPPPGRRA